MGERVGDLAARAVWFKDMGRCYLGCGRAAHGQLMNLRNESIGNYCQRCATKILKLRKKMKTEDLAV